MYHSPFDQPGYKKKAKKKRKAKARKKVAKKKAKKAPARKKAKKVKKRTAKKAKKVVRKAKKKAPARKKSKKRVAKGSCPRCGGGGRAPGPCGCPRKKAKKKAAKKSKAKRHKAPSVYTAAAQGIRVHCITEKGKIRVRPVPGQGYPSTKNVQFPRHLRRPGCQYVVDDLDDRGTHFRAVGEIRPF